MNDLLKSYLYGLLRHALTGASVWLIANGISTEEQNHQVLIGLAAGLASLLLQLWTKYRDRILLLTGLAMPPGSTVQDAKEVIAKGAAPPAATANREIPRLQQPPQ